MRLKNIFKIPVFMIGNTAGHIHTIDVMDIRNGVLLVGGSGLVLRGTLDSGLADISWYERKVRSGDRYSGPIDFEDPWITPLAARQLSDAIVRIVGYSDNKLDILESPDSGASWVTVNILEREQSSGDALLSSAVSLFSDGSAVCICTLGGVYCVLRVDSFGMYNKIVELQVPEQSWRVPCLAVSDAGTCYLAVPNVPEIEAEELGIAAKSIVAESVVYESRDFGNSWNRFYSCPEVVKSIYVGINERLVILGEQAIYIREDRSCELEEVQLPDNLEVDNLSVNGNVIWLYGAECSISAYEDGKFVTLPRVVGEVPGAVVHLTPFTDGSLLVATTGGVWMSDTAVHPRHLLEPIVFTDS